MRKKQIRVCVNDAEKVRLDEQAEQTGLSLSSWARTESLKNAREQMEIYGGGVPHRRTAELPLLSLFCGPGGLDEGFRQAGFDTVIAIDNDEECTRTFRLNHPAAEVLCASVNELEIEDFDRLSGRVLKPVGVVGGPPCQSFSVSNVHQRDDDARHKLPESYARLLKDLNKRSPISFFVFENVPGLLGKKHKHRYDKFRKLFERAGFELFEELLDAKDYGVPQERIRVFIIGINRKLHPDAEWRTPEPEKNVRTVRDAIGGLAEPVYNGDAKIPEKFPVHPNHWCLVPRSDKFKAGRLKPGEMWGRSFRTLVWDEPSWTVAYGHREVHVHPKGHRRLSMYEAMRLQTFPHNYRLTGNLSAQIRLVSEAVPPRMAWHIAVNIRKVLGF